MLKGKNLWVKFVFLGTVLLATDLIIKWIMNLSLEMHVEKGTFLPNVSLFLTHNKGYHYLFGEIGNYQLFNIIAMLLAIGFIIVLILNLRNPSTTSREKYFIGIILACVIGASANPLEALITGKVTDWFIFRPFPWPSNLADQYANFITWIMLPLFIISELFLKKKKNPPQEKVKINNDASSESNSG